MKNTIFITTLIVSYIIMFYGIVSNQIFLFGLGELLILSIFALKSQIFYSLSDKIKRLSLKEYKILQVC